MIKENHIAEAHNLQIRKHRLLLQRTMQPLANSASVNICFWKVAFRPYKSWRLLQYPVLGATPVWGLPLHYPFTLQ